MLKWNFSITEQERYYADIHQNLENMRYQQMGFYVLPYLPEKFRVRVIYFPKEKIFEVIYQKHKIEIEKLKNNFDKEKITFEKKLLDVFGELNLEIMVSPQLIGSFGSFDIEGKKLVIRPRFDRNLMGVMRLIIRAITSYLNPKLNPKDLQKEVENNVAKFDMKGNSLREMLYRNMAGKYIEESYNYLQELGYEIKGGDIDFDKIRLTKKEKSIVNLLQKNQNRMVTNDQIADAVWGDLVDEKYSLYAISKLMDRLRRKIYESSGRNVVHSQRGVGYVMQS
jgi:DNA-binding winged helix-turn-helix (wHTH) protein